MKFYLFFLFIFSSYFLSSVAFSAKRSTRKKYSTASDPVIFFSKDFIKWNEASGSEVYRIENYLAPMRSFQESLDESNPQLSQSFENYDNIPTSYSMDNLISYFNNQLQPLQKRTNLEKCSGSVGHLKFIKSYANNQIELPYETAKQYVSSVKSGDQSFSLFALSSKIAAYKAGLDNSPHKFWLKHQLLGLCISCQTSAGTTYHQFLLDRGLKMTGPNNLLYNTMIRLFYYAQPTNCHPNDSSWVDQKTDKAEITDSTDMSGKSVTMNDILTDAFWYMKAFPKYTAFLLNCQHFSTNLYNKLTGKQTHFPNHDVLNVGVEGGDSAMYNAQFPKP